jgi:Asp-tRNA(Asn)/Glu-tRNA(Gln) amidotransferase A subunit family amidase
LYYETTKSLPLNGLRIAVKDVFHMKGLRTSVCNRAYHNFYPPQDATAPSLTRLVECGALLVGKTHLSSFAWKEEPTECIDYQAPFNPRGDGYQSPAGSSSGSGAAIASYDWLDFTIGTDSMKSFSLLVFVSNL